jgi:sugar transferase (PEP-CTERM/EpsH1 system associated)
LLISAAPPPHGLRGGAEGTQQINKSTIQQIPVKILFLTHRLPCPPNRGGRIRPFNVLKHLSRNHTVTVATLVGPDDDAAAVAQLREISAQQILAPMTHAMSWLRTVASAPSPTPSSFAHFYSPRLANAVNRALLDRHDLIIVHSACMAPYVAHAPGAKILDFVDMDSQKWLAYATRKPWPAALAYRWEGAKVRRAEARLAGVFDLCTCATAAETATLDGYGVAQRSAWFRNGVDAEYFHPSDGAYDPDAICFLGRMDYFPNQDAMRWFCEGVFPPLRAQRPAATLTIVGAGPSRAVRRLGERPGIRVTGSVADVRPYAQRAAVTVAPMTIARGTQNKILESLAMGVPVVASEVAAHGTETVPELHLLTAREPRDFVAAILRVLGDPQERTRLARSGRARMLSHHTWDASMRRLDELIAACLTERPS